VGEFAGLIRRDWGTIDSDDERRLAQSLLSNGAPCIWRPGPFAVFAEGRDTIWPGRTTAPRPEQDHPGKTLLVDGRFDSAREVAEALGVPCPSRERGLFATACRKWGAEGLARRHGGEFSIAEWDDDRRRLTLVRDALGGMPLYYYETPDLILFSSSLRTMLAMPQVPRDLDDVAIAHIMTSAVADPLQTLYRHIRRAPPGGVMVFEGGTQRSSVYFDATAIKPVRLASDDAYVEQGRDLLDRCVESCFPAEGSLATDLSGGYDSGGIAATAARLMGGKRLLAFTRLPGVQCADGDKERRHAALLVDRYPNIDWHIVDRTREAPRDSDPEAEARSTLLPRSSGFNATWIESKMYAVQASGASVLLYGSSGNTTLSYHGQPSALGEMRAGRFGNVLRDWRAMARRREIPLARAVASGLYQSLAPRSLRRLRAGRNPWLGYSLVSPEFLAEMDYEALARSAGHDIPFNLPGSQVAARLRLLQAQRGVDFVTYARARWSFDARDPYRDRRMVEFCLGVPQDQYWRGGERRWLARRVLADRVPAETLAQTRQALQAPEWFMLGSSHRDAMAEAIDRIARSPAASRVIDVPRLRALLDGWPADADAAQASYMLHGVALPRAIAMGGYLRWHEGRND
jgi:asparagine synthase (glutamine-hydrolysing)